MVDKFDGAEEVEVGQKGMKTNHWMSKRRIFSGLATRLRKMLKCIRSGEQMRKAENEYGDNEMVDHSSDSLATRDYSASGYSSRPGEVEQKVDTSNIEEAESSLRESGYLNYEVCLFVAF